MTEPGDKIPRTYRDLAREEPSSSLDATILAASKRALQRPSASTMPASPQAFPMQQNVAPSPAPAGTSSDAAQAPAAPSLLKRQAAPAGTVSTKAGAPDAADAELERIAALRAQGRDAEADKALDEFRRTHPGYRIPDAMWERVKPR